MAVINWTPTKAELNATQIGLAMSENNAIILEQLSCGLYVMRRLFMNAKGKTVVAGRTSFTDTDNANASFIAWCKRFLDPNRIIDGSTFDKDVFFY